MDDFFDFSENLYGIGQRRKRRRTRRARRRGAPTCKTITFKRRVRGGRILPRSQWVTVRRCKGRRLRAPNPHQCRRGGAGPDAYLFTKCPPGMTRGFVRPLKRRRRRRR